MREYVSKVELGYSWSVDFFSAGNKQCRFGAVMVGDGENGVKAPRFRELDDEIKGNCLEGKGVLRFDWVEGGSCLVCVHFVCLALSAALHVVDNKLLHVRPPVVAFEEGKCVQNSGVSGHRCVMVEVQHPFLKVVVPNDYKGVTLPPEVV